MSKRTRKWLFTTGVLAAVAFIGVGAVYTTNSKKNATKDNKTVAVKAATDIDNQLLANESVVTTILGYSDKKDDKTIELSATMAKLRLNNQKQNAKLDKQVEKTRYMAISNKDYLKAVNAVRDDTNTNLETLSKLNKDNHDATMKTIKKFQSNSASKFQTFQDAQIKYLLDAGYTKDKAQTKSASLLKDVNQKPFDEAEQKQLNDIVNKQ